VSGDHAGAKLSLRRDAVSPAPAGASHRISIHKAISDFKVTLGHQLVEFKMGELITDERLIQRLRDQHCPIGPVDQALRNRCVKCGTVTPIVLPLEELRIIASSMGLDLVQKKYS